MKKVNSDQIQPYYSELQEKNNYRPIVRYFNRIINKKTLKIELMVCIIYHITYVSIHQENQMKIKLFLAIVCGLFLTITSLVSCSDSESRFGLPGRTAKVTISLGMPAENPALSDNTIWKTIRSIFISDAMAQTAPATFSSVAVTVTAPDITTIQQTFTGSGAMTLTIPAGSARQIGIIATVDPADPSAALSFKGTTTTDLTADTSVNVPVAMTLNETKIVIPDPFFNISVPIAQQVRRIIQINNISGAGWIEKVGSNIGFTGTFYPYAIDFDARGRIYIANNNGITGSSVVIRINNINSTTCSNLGSGGGSGILAVAVDRIRNYVYYATSVQLRRFNADATGSGDTLLLTNSGVELIQTITGLDVDPNGNLVISGKNTSGLDRIFQYDPTLQIITKTFSSANLISPEDVQFKAPYIYVANPSGPNNFKILQLDTNLQYVPGYGTQVTPFATNTNPGMFYGPRKFLAIRNDSLIIIDDIPTGTDIDKLISIQDIAGTGWTTYGTEGKGVGQFMFYYGC